MGTENLSVSQKNFRAENIVDGIKPRTLDSPAKENYMWTVAGEHQKIIKMSNL